MNEPQRIEAAKIGGVNRVQVLIEGSELVCKPDNC